MIPVTLSGKDKHFARQIFTNPKQCSEEESEQEH